MCGGTGIMPAISVPPFLKTVYSIPGMRFTSDVQPNRPQ